MGNESSKPAPESENTARLRNVFADIKKHNKEFHERELAAQQRRAHEDTQWAAERELAAQQCRARDDAQRAAAEASRQDKVKEGIPATHYNVVDAAAREKALAEQERLVQKRRSSANAPAAHPSASKDIDISEEDSTTSAPGTPLDIPDILAGWNPRKEPRPKSSSGNSREQGQQMRSDVVSAQQTEQETTRERADLKEPSERKRQTPSGITPKAQAAPSAPRPKQQPQADPNSAKRAEPASGFEQSGRRESSGISLQKRPKAADNLGSSSSSRPPATPGNEAERQEPDWYRRMSVVAKRGSNTGNADALLDRLKDQIAVLKRKGPSGINTTDLNNLRESLHEAPFLAMGTAGPQLLRNKRMLHNNDGLPQIFDDRYAGPMKGHWPWDIKSDAAELYHKWCSRNFNDDMLFGLVLAQKSSGKNAEDDRKADTVDKNFQVSSKYKGNGKLVNGQWWPTLLCALRDGAHGDSQAGISGDTGVGAYSCFISGGEKHQYPDLDEGDVVHYYGQDTTTAGQLSRGTALLKKNKIDGIPVRFIRSSKAKTHSGYAPPIGFRYDGLYDVVSYELKDKTKERYCFKLVRQPGQGPIRGGGGPEARPTRQEHDRFEQDKRFRGLGGKN